MYHRVTFAALYARLLASPASSSSTSPTTTRNDAPENLSMLISRPRSSAVAEKNLLSSGPSSARRPRAAVVLPCLRGRYALRFYNPPFKKVLLPFKSSDCRESATLGISCILQTDFLIVLEGFLCRGRFLFNSIQRRVDSLVNDDHFCEV